MVKYISDSKINATRDDLQEEFRMEFEKNNGVYKEIFNEVTIGDNDQKSKFLKGKSVGGMALPKEYTIGEDVQESDVIDGYEYLIEYKLFRHAVAEYDLDRRNARKSLMGLFDATMEMTEAFADRVEIECFNVFNNGTSLIGPDGVPFFSASHPIKSDQFSNSSSVWSNYKTSLAFTPDNYYTARYTLKALQRRLNGDKAIMTPSILLVPDALETEADKLIQSPGEYTNANNSVMPHKIRPIVAPRLDDASTRTNSTWYLLADKKKHGLYVVWRMKPTITIEEVPRSMKLVTYMDMYFGVGLKHQYGVVRCDA